MGLQQFERRLERLVEGVFAKAFRGALQPVEIGRRLTREMDLRRTVAPKGTLTPNQFTVVLSASDRPLAVRAAMRAGALGYVLKSEPTTRIRAAITEVAAGRDWISPRLAYILATDDDPGRPALSEQERRALQLYATGMPAKSVARRMAISDETVKQYLQRVRQKYARAGRPAPTKLELHRRAVEDGLISPPEVNGGYH